MPVPVILGQLTLGLVNGSFYALLSLGLAVIFGLMGVVNFAHGAFYTLGAFAALLGLQYLGINYWLALLLAPLAVGLLGVLSAKQMGAERIIAMSRHEKRQKLAREFGATVHLSTVACDLLHLLDLLRFRRARFTRRL